MELLLNLTIAGTATAIIILFIKLVFRNKLTPKWHFYIWIILAIRLLIPGLPESDFSLLNTIPTAKNITAVERQMESIHPEESKENYIEGNITMKSPITGVQTGRDFSITKQKVNIIVFGWLTGMALMAIYLVGAYKVFNMRAKILPESMDPAKLDLLDKCKREVGVFRKITLRIGGNTPMLHGLFHPTIIIPDNYTIEELRHIFIHELCHYKHKDIFINMICCFFLCVYWFNLIMWLCFYVIRRDIELLCDQRVIEVTGDRKEYAKVLLRTALRKNRFIFATTSMQNGEKEVAKRIKYIAYFKKPKIWISVLAVALAGIIGIMCLTDASFKNTIIWDAGLDGYFFKIPASWVENAVDGSNDSTQNNFGPTMFYNKDGKNFGGIDALSIDMDPYMAPSGLRQQGIPYVGEVDYETIVLPVPNHSEILERKVIEEMPFTTVLINLDHDLETAAGQAERNEAGDDSPIKKMNQNHLFIWPGEYSAQIYDLWADSSEVTEEELIEIAKTFRRNSYPQGYQPEIDFKTYWTETANRLLRDYFQNYVDSEMTKATDISGYRIHHMKEYKDKDASWSIIYPNTVVFKVDYLLEIAYPSRYSFAGGGFQIGKDRKTKIYKNELAVFQVNPITNIGRFLGFVWPQDRGEMGEAMAIVHTINYANFEDRAEALLGYKTPYIGNNSKVGGIISNMPLAQYFTGMELQTKKEPYGLTVNYDLTKAGSAIFDNSNDRALTDSRGWDPNAHLKSQLYQNSAMLLSLIDNASIITIKISGISENGVPYTYSCSLDRVILNKQFVQDARLSTESIEKFCEFLSALDQSQTYPESDTIYQIN